IAPKHGACSTAVLQLEKRASNKLGEVFFTSHELIAFTPVGFGPVHDMRGFAWLRGAAPELFHENWFAAECRGHSAGERNKIWVKWFARPRRVHGIRVHHSDICVGI